MTSGQSCVAQTCSELGFSCYTTNISKQTAKIGKISWRCTGWKCDLFPMWGYEFSSLEDHSVAVTQRLRQLNKIGYLTGIGDIQKCWGAVFILKKVEHIQGRGETLPKSEKICIRNISVYFF